MTKKATARRKPVPPGGKSHSGGRKGKATDAAKAVEREKLVARGVDLSTAMELVADGENVDLEVGQTLTVELFAEMSHVDVVGTSKGRGFAGVMKRHNFAGQRASHGVKRVHRHGGGIGMSADPARVLKGTRMPGRYGNARSTVRHMQVVRVDAETNSMLIKGGVPGPPGGYVLIRPTNKLG